MEAAIFLLYGLDKMFFLDQKLTQSFQIGSFLYRPSLSANR